jgi:hypothetical protein
MWWQIINYVYAEWIIVDFPVVLLSMPFMLILVLCLRQLLEGLQSSLIVSKVPGEKGPRTNYRSASSRGDSSFSCL